MKRAILAAFIGALMALTGCASVPDVESVHLTPDQANLVREGKLITPTSIVSGSRFGMYESISKAKLKNGIYVCATSFSNGEYKKSDGSCYPHVSALIAKRFADIGVKIDQDSASADAVVQIGIMYGRNDVYTDRSYKSIIDQMEASLAKNGTESATLQKFQADHSNLYAAAAVRVVGLLLNVNPVQQAGSVTSALNGPTGSPNLVVSKVEVVVVPAQNKGTVLSGKKYARSGIYYYGPKSNEAFPAVFDADIEDTATRLFVQ